jgi:mycoredoxin
MSDFAHPETVTMYSADWCPDCRRSKRLLDGRGVTYTLVDLVADPTRAAEAEAISGFKSIPVVVFPDGDFLVEPTDADLAGKLNAIGL